MDEDDPPELELDEPEDDDPDEEDEDDELDAADDELDAELDELGAELDELDDEALADEPAEALDELDAVSVGCEGLSVQSVVRRPPTVSAVPPESLRRNCRRDSSRSDSLMTLPFLGRLAALLIAEGATREI